MVKGHIHCRLAAPGDAAGIVRVLTEVAPEIPLVIDTKEQQEAVSKIVDKCIAEGGSCVATDGGGVVAGFILVEPDEIERFQHDNQALHLRYAGVSKTCRRQGIFRALIQQVMKRSVPLTATVKAANRCQMGALLRRVGFQRWSGDPQIQEHFRWQPAVTEAITVVP
jgi:ribosomal protein S18 acetylase RimI-like enzyme